MSENLANAGPIENLSGILPDVEVDVGMSANSIDEAVSAHVFEDPIDVEIDVGMSENYGNEASSEPHSAAPTDLGIVLDQVERVIEMAKNCDPLDTSTKKVVDTLQELSQKYEQSTAHQDFDSSKTAFMNTVSHLIKTYKRHRVFRIMQEINKLQLELLKVMTDMDVV